MTASATSSSTSAVFSEIQSLWFLAWLHLKIFDNFSFFTTTLIFINDEDFVLLYDIFSSSNPSFRYYKYACFDLNNMSDAECKAEFRFEKKDLPAVAEALQIPPSFKLLQRSIVSGMVGLCILVRWLAYPCSLFCLHWTFVFGYF